MKKRLPAARERAESGLGLGASPARAQRSTTLNLHRHRASARFATPPRLAAGQAHSHAARRTLPLGGRDEQHPRTYHGRCRPKRCFHRRWHHQSPEHTPGNCPPRHRAGRSASRRRRKPLLLGTPGRSNPRSDHRTMPPTRRHTKCTVSARLSRMVVVKRADARGGRLRARGGKHGTRSSSSEESSAGSKGSNTPSMSRNTTSIAAGPSATPPVSF